MAPGEPPPARRRAAALAGHQGDEAGARAMLGDPDPAVRATAFGALARLAVLTPTDLDAAAADPDTAVRRRATELAAEAPPDWTSDVAVAVLARLLADEDPTVVESAAWACGEQGAAGAPVVEHLSGVVRQHPDALCREAAVAALGAIGHPRGLAAILDALGDRATVRRRAIIALAPFEGDEVDDALRRHTTDRDRQVRQAAEDLLGR